METSEYCFTCQDCGGDLSFVANDEAGCVRVEPCRCCQTEPEVEDEIKGVCIYTDCKHEDTAGCRVSGLGVSGIDNCVKYRVHVPLTSRRKIPG